MRFRQLFVIASLATSVSAHSQDDLDIQAWNLLWEKMESVVKTNAVPLDESETLNLLIVPRPLAGPDDPNDLDKFQLMNIAGVIPKSDFALDISEDDRKLHQAYADIIYRLMIDGGTPDQQQAYLAASTEYENATKAFVKASDEWRAQIIKDIDFVKATGGTVTRDKYFDIRDANSGLIAGSLARLDQANIALQNAALGDHLLVDTVRSLKRAIDGSQESTTYGLFNYRITDPIERSECTSDDQWSEIKLNKNTKAQSVRRSGWNANGRWSGTFLKIGMGGAGSNFSNTVKTNSEYVVLRFCHLNYVNVSAPWLNMETLRSVQRGDVKLKAGTPPQYAVPLGPDGLIPRRVKGLLVARSISFIAQLDRKILTEIKKAKGGGGGFSIGPWRIGGGGSKFSYDISDTENQGYVKITSVGSHPVILGVLLEETKF